MAGNPQNQSSFNKTESERTLPGNDNLSGFSSSTANNKMGSGWIQLPDEDVVDANILQFRFYFQFQHFVIYYFGHFKSIKFNR